MYYNLYRLKDGSISTNPNISPGSLGVPTLERSRLASMKNDPNLKWLGAIFIEEPKPSPQFFPA